MNKMSKIGLSVLLITVSWPCLAQAVGGDRFGDPVTMINNIARAGLLAGAGIMTIAGGYKAIQVWSGSRNFFEAATYLLGGAALFFGTAATVGL